MSLQSPNVFCNPDVLADGWYWALPSATLKIGDRKALTVFGDDLVLYRSHLGSVHCLTAYCPHMGAHLKEGRVEGPNLRCGFHGWKFDGNGVCIDLPCSSKTAQAPQIAKIKSYSVREKFGMIWIYSVPDQTTGLPDLPNFPELEGQDVCVSVDPIETRNCHPTLILGGGVDEEHFKFVHSGTTASTGPLSFSHKILSKSVIHFANTATIQGASLKTKILRRLYGQTLQYEVTYWTASTALASLGFPALPLYAIFAYRPTFEGKTEGLNIYVTKKRHGPIGRFVSWFAIMLTRSILRKGGGEDRIIQNSIRFQPSAYAFENPPFRAFVEYVERQPFRRFQSEVRK